MTSDEKSGKSVKVKITPLAMMKDLLLDFR
jgi:hypothetical protein